MMTRGTGEVREIEIDEGDAPFLMSRVTTKRPSVPIVKADISSISATIYNITTGVAVESLAATALDKTIVWSDTLVVTDDWTEDEDGYNLGWQTEGSYFTCESGLPETFRVVVRVSLVAGGTCGGGKWDVISKPTDVL